MNSFEELTEKALEGEISPLKAFIDLKKEIERLSQLQDKVKRLAIEEAGQEDNKKFEIFGAIVTYVESAGSRWDFSQIPEWKEKSTELKNIEQKHKAAYQAWKRGAIYVDEETGEQVTPAAYKEGNPTIQVKIK